MPLLVAVVAMVRVWVFTIDDAYISYRYARNLARGWGLVYNHGERVEGYTNFLWTVMLGGVHAVGVDLDLGAKVLGALATLASIALVYRLALRVRRVTWIPCLATWVVASSMVFTGYGVFGLETPLFSALVLGGGLLFLNEEDGAQGGVSLPRGRAFPWSAIVFGAAALTRPEAPLYFGLWMLLQRGPRLFERTRGPRSAVSSVGAKALWGLDPRTSVVVGLVALAWLLVGYLHLRAPTLGQTIGFGLIGLGAAASLIALLPRRLVSRRNLIRGGVFVGILAAHLLWRRSYYGAWLPNTLIAKTGDVRQQLAGGWLYLNDFLGHESGMLVLAIFGCAAAMLWRYTELLYAAALAGLMAVYVVIVGGDWMPLHRFFAPVVPFMALLVGVGTRSLLERRDRLVSTALWLLLLVVGLQRWRVGEADVAKILHDAHPFWRNSATPTAAWFAARTQRYGDDARGLIAMGDIGEVGYTSDFPVFDLLGLVDPVIARQPGGYTRKTGKGYVDRFFEVRPRYVVLITDDVACTHPYHPGSKVLFYDHRFKRDYAVAHVTEVGAWGWCIFEHRALMPADSTGSSAD